MGTHKFIQVPEKMPQAMKSTAQAIVFMSHAADDVTSCDKWQKGSLI